MDDGRTPRKPFYYRKIKKIKIRVAPDVCWFVCGALFSHNEQFARWSISMAEEEEVLAEVEAVQSVYGDDCLAIDKFPPHLQVHVKPRTADVSSQEVFPSELYAICFNLLLGREWSFEFSMKLRCIKRKMICANHTVICHLILQFLVVRWLFFIFMC